MKSLRTIFVVIAVALCNISSTMAACISEKIQFPHTGDVFFVNDYLYYGATEGCANNQYRWSIEYIRNGQTSGPISLGIGQSGQTLIPNDATINSVTLNLMVDGDFGLDGDRISLQPSLVNVTMNSSVPGVTLGAGNTNVIAPKTIQLPKGFTMTLSAAPSQFVNNVNYVFKSWEHGGSAIQTVTIPNSDVTYTANYGRQYHLTVNGGYTSGDYFAGDRIPIAAYPPPSGQVFKNWTGAPVEDPNASQTYLVMPAADANVSVVFGEIGSKLSFSADSYKWDEDKGAVAITVKREEGLTGAVSVKYSATQATAVSGIDFTEVNNGTLSWADGDASPKTFLVQVLNDETPEFGKTISLTLSNPAGPAVLGLSSAVLTIVDDDEVSVSVQNGTGSGWYVLGSTVNIAATIPANALFDRWTTNSPNSMRLFNENQANTTFVIESPQTLLLTATFKQGYQITIVNGTGPGSAMAGDVVRLTANTPTDHQAFEGWTSADVVINSPDSPTAASFKMPSKNVTVKANYKYDDSITPDQLAGVGGNAVIYTAYENGVNATFQWQKDGVDIPAATKPNYEMSSVTENDRGIYRCKVALNGTQFTTKESKLFIAKIISPAPGFKFSVQQLIPLAYSITGPGNATWTGATPNFTAIYWTGSSGGEWDLIVDNGTSPATLVVPNFDLSRWQSLSISLGNGVKIYSTMSIYPRVVNVSSTGSMGPIKINDQTLLSAKQFVAGTTLSISAAPTITVNEKTLQFKKWSDESTLPQRFYNVPEQDVNIRAIYEEIYTLTVAGGSGSGVYVPSQVIEIDAPAVLQGKVFDRWVGATVAYSTSPKTTVVMPAAATTVTATYKDIPDTNPPGEPGQVEKLLTIVHGHLQNGFNVSRVVVGSTVTIVADEPSEGEEFFQWVNAAVFDPSSHVTKLLMPNADLIVIAAYKPKTIVLAPGNSETLGKIVNPFPAGAGTIIPVNVDHPQEIELAVFDLRSHKVRDVFKDTVSPPGMNIPWDGKDDNGSLVPSDVYLMILRHDGGTIKRKVIVEK